MDPLRWTLCKQDAQCIVLEEKYSVPSRAKKEGPSRNVIASSALPRWSCRKTLVNAGRSTVGETGSRMSRIYMRVARDPLNAVDGVHIALGPLLAKGEERGRFEGKHRERCHQRI